MRADSKKEGRCLVAVLHTRKTNPGIKYRLLTRPRRLIHSRHLLFFSFSCFLLYIFHFVFNLNLFDFILFAFKFSKCFEITWRQNKCDINILEVMESFFVLVSHRRPDPAWCSARIRDKVTVGKRASAGLTHWYIYTTTANCPRSRYGRSNRKFTKGVWGYRIHPLLFCCMGLLRESGNVRNL